MVTDPALSSELDAVRAFAAALQAENAALKKANEGLKEENKELKARLGANRGEIRGEKGGNLRATKVMILLF